MNEPKEKQTERPYPNLEMQSTTLPDAWDKSKDEDDNHAAK